jgi:hypothetical protein
MFDCVLNRLAYCVQLITLLLALLAVLQLVAAGRWLTSYKINQSAIPYSQLFSTCLLERRCNVYICIRYVHLQVSQRLVTFFIYS